MAPRTLAIERSAGIIPTADQSEVGATMRVIGKIRSALVNDTRGEYRCQQCGAGFELDRQVCPVCGGYRIESTEWSEE